MGRIPHLLFKPGPQGDEPRNSDAGLLRQEVEEVAVLRPRPETETPWTFGRGLERAGPSAKGSGQLQDCCQDLEQAALF